MLIFKCEWIWAQICLLKSALSMAPRKKYHLRFTCKKVFRVTSQLKLLIDDDTFKKSINNSTELMEYLAYVNWIEGVAHVELGNLSRALLNLKKSTILLQDLVQRCSHSGTGTGAGTGAGTGTGAGALFKEVLEKRINDLQFPIRFAAYNLEKKPEDEEDEIEKELEAFKLNLLSQQVSETDIKDSRKIMFIGSKSFELSSLIQEEDISTSKALQICKNELKKTSKDSIDRENGLIQILYFEKIRLVANLSEKVKKFSSTSTKVLKRKKPLCQSILRDLSKLISRTELVLVPEFSAALESIKSLFNAYMAISEVIEYNFKGGDERQARIALGAAKLLSSQVIIADCSFLLDFSTVYNNLLILIRKAENSIKPTVRVMPPAPVIPKPSFYDVAFDFLSFKPAASQPQPQTQPQSQEQKVKGLFSGFWNRN